MTRMTSTTVTSQLSFKEATGRKSAILNTQCVEYRRVVNEFINLMWSGGIIISKGMKSKKDQYSLVPTTLIVRHTRAAFDEARGMVLSAESHRTKKKPVKTDLIFKTSESVALTKSKTSRFDYWLEVGGLGKTYRLPVKSNKHFNKLLSIEGSKVSSYFVINPTTKIVSTTVTVSHETVEYTDDSKVVGLDSGIKSLASLDNGDQYGRDLSSVINSRLRKVKHSKGYNRAKSEQHNMIDRLAREIVQDIKKCGGDFIVLEDLAGINQGTKKNDKRRLSKNMRRVIGYWNIRRFHRMIQKQGVLNRVRVFFVDPRNTSRICSVCGHTDKDNRRGEVFCCLSCGHTDNADVNAAKNIRNRGSLILRNFLLRVSSKDTRKTCDS